MLVLPLQVSVTSVHAVVLAMHCTVQRPGRSYACLHQSRTPCAITAAFVLFADTGQLSSPRNAPSQILTESAIPVSIEDREQLIRAANTSLSSTIISQNSRWGCKVSSAVGWIDLQHAAAYDGALPVQYTYTCPACRE